MGRVLIGDAARQMRRLPENSVGTVGTSPPYFMLRDYGMEGQIGWEAAGQLKVGPGQNFAVEKGAVFVAAGVIDAEAAAKRIKRGGRAREF